jgi:hypothetical protein
MIAFWMSLSLGPAASEGFWPDGGTLAEDDELGFGLGFGFGVGVEGQAVSPTAMTVPAINPTMHRMKPGRCARAAKCVHA